MPENEGMSHGEYEAAFYDTPLPPDETSSSPRLDESERIYRETVVVSGYQMLRKSLEHRDLPIGRRVND